MIGWARGWKPLDDAKLRRHFERELAWELEGNPAHALAGWSFEVIGGLGGYDDFVVRLDGRDTFVWVHLAWRREASPEWPHTKLVGDLDGLNRFLGQWDADGDESDA